MANPVARLASGRILDVDLVGGISASEARRRIGMAMDVPFSRVPVVSPLTHMAPEDNDKLSMEVGVVLLRVDPEAEAAAESRVLERLRENPWAWPRGEPGAPSAGRAPSAGIAPISMATPEGPGSAAVSIAGMGPGKAPGYGADVFLILGRRLSRNRTGALNSVPRLPKLASMPRVGKTCTQFSSQGPGRAGVAPRARRAVGGYWIWDMDLGKIPRLGRLPGPGARRSGAGAGCN